MIPTNDQRWHLMATPTVTLRSELAWEIDLLESWKSATDTLPGGGLLADEITILRQLKACASFRGLVGS
jgi:hypothetical protein